MAKGSKVSDLEYTFDSTCTQTARAGRILRGAKAQHGVASALCPVSHVEGADTVAQPLMIRMQAAQENLDDVAHDGHC